MRLLPLLLLLACAGGAPTQYAQGVPTPRPPVFNPTTDSPITVGQPGRVRAQPLPRSPHQRQLPPPGDWPGVWGADPPKASATTKPTSYPKVFGYDMVMADREDPTETFAAGTCVAILKEEIPRRPALRDAIENLVPDEKRCAAAHAYAVCMNHLLGMSYRLAMADDSRPTANVNTLATAAATAERARQAACGDDDPSQNPVLGALNIVIGELIPEGRP